MDPEPAAELLLVLVSMINLLGLGGILISLGILIVLLILSALVSGSEVAFFSLSPHDLEVLDNDDSPASQRAFKLRKKPRKLLATILISNNFINIAIVVVSDYIIRNILGSDRLLAIGNTISSWLPGEIDPASLGSAFNILITVIGVTFLLVLFGEVAPKIYANLNNLSFAKMMSRPMSILSVIFRPISAMLVGWSSKLESLFIYQKSGIDNTSKDELDRAIQLTVSEGTDSDDTDILRGIIKFGNVSAKQIMRSRVDVIAIEIEEDFSTLMQLIRESGFSRIPVYKEDFDNILGILYVKDLLGYSSESPSFNWQKFVRDNILYVPESKKIDDLLKEFQQKRVHMGIVVDEFGGSSGIITLEDIMEEVVGEIKDEFDEDEEVDYIKINDANYIFDGKTMLHDVARIINVEKNSFDSIKGEADSLAGLLLLHLGYIPKKDKTLTLNHFKFKIVSVSKRRIEKIHITIL